MIDLEVTRIGVAASEALQNFSSGKVVGVTSKGAFLRAYDRILFLTATNYLSPFNLTLDSGEQRFQKLAVGDEFSIRADQIDFPAARITLRTAAAQVWIPPQPVPVKASFSWQHDSSEKIIQQLRQLDASKGYLFLTQTPEDHLPESQVRIYQAASEITSSFRSQDRDGFVLAAGKLLGSGSGLTPSGDDFLTGFFLYHFRFDLATGQQRSFVTKWCTWLTGQAFQKTTTISANRLMATPRGWSEGIFLTLIDHLFDPDISFGDDLVRTLMEIGHSSGVDTVMGIVYALESML